MFQRKSKKNIDSKEIMEFEFEETKKRTYVYETMTVFKQDVNFHFRTLTPFTLTIKNLLLLAYNYCRHLPPNMTMRNHRTMVQ